jgi:hypothetical protein
VLRVLLLVRKLERRTLLFLLAFYVLMFEDRNLMVFWYMWLLSVDINDLEIIWNRGVRDKKM